VSFTASASDSLGHAVGYQWAEGSTVLSTSQTFSTSALSVGTHTITLTASCDGGESATRTISVTVNDEADVVMILSASATPEPALKGQTITFNASAADSLDHPVTYRWSEGTMVLSSSQKFSTSRLLVGTHTITLTATCASGSYAVQTLAVTVTDVSISVSSKVSADKKTVVLTASASDKGGHTITGYEWSVNGSVATASTSKVLSVPVASLVPGPNLVTVRAFCSGDMVSRYATVSIQVNETSGLVSSSSVLRQ